MELHFLKGKTGNIWKDNKPFFLFVLTQVIILSVIKLIFYNYNYTLLFAEGNFSNNGSLKLKLIYWSMFYDVIIVFAVNFLFLFFLQLSIVIKNKIWAYSIVLFFLIINTIIVLLNVADIFYYKFHLQRLNADVRFVIDHPFQLFFHQPFFVITSFILMLVLIGFVYYKMHFSFYKKFKNGSRAILSTTVFLILLLSLVFIKDKVSKKLVPTYPLLDISSKHLPIVQNSFHTFIYSIFRDGQYVPVKNYFSQQMCDSLYPIIKHATPNLQNGSKKNVVLFIMESIPFDFFDTSNGYKVAMPFFDTLLKKSTFYNNAYSYALESNKGIVSILAGIPTLTDIPLYHSPYINMPLTAVGKQLDKQGYTSFFCIGDEYDNFGFAKCANWLGINNYYSMDDMVGYKKKPRHSLGMQDEDVFHFLHDKIKEKQQPFLAINYNISTHYPYDIPASYQFNFPKKYTNAMKAMQYYDHCMSSFFQQSKNESWYNNTIFIFCSDHWMYPNQHSKILNSRKSYRIPIIIYDPINTVKKVEQQLVSQFDILGTILHIADNKENYISYGNDLLSSNGSSNIIVTKMSSSLYQGIDSSYMVGYNILSEKTEYLFDYSMDENLKNNLVNNVKFKQKQNEITDKIKAFVQKASMQYNNKSFK